jgi:hypothetical protein
MNGNGMALRWVISTRSLNSLVSKDINEVINSAYEGDPFENPFVPKSFLLPMPLAIHAVFTPGTAKLAGNTVRGYLFQVEFSFRHHVKIFENEDGMYQGADGYWYPKSSANHDTVTKSEAACFLSTNDEDMFTGLYKVGTYSDFTEE